MTLKEFYSLADRITYKGQKCLMIKAISTELFVVDLYVRVIDVETGRPGFVASESPYTLTMIEEAKEDNMFAWVRDQIMLTEMHEANENIRVDGERRYNPHAKPLFKKRKLEAA